MSKQPLAEVSDTNRSSSSFDQTLPVGLLGLQTSKPSNPFSKAFSMASQSGEKSAFALT
jgi:hypothetical protein